MFPTLSWSPKISGVIPASSGWSPREQVIPAMLPSLERKDGEGRNDCNKLLSATHVWQIFFFFFGKNAFLNNKFLVNVWLERKKFFGFAWKIFLENVWLKMGIEKKKFWRNDHQTGAKQEGLPTFMWKKMWQKE